MTYLDVALYFCWRGRDTTYAKQNNGNFTFVVERILALPDDEVNSLLINFFGILKEYQENMLS